MNERVMGTALMIVGALLVVAGVGGWVMSAGGEATTTVATTTTAPRPTTTTLPMTTSTLQATTTAAPTTTTTIDATGEIEEFVKAFADAIAGEDVEFLFETLHPAVISLFDEPACRTFISEDIVQLAEYRLIGEVDGPTLQSIGGMTVEMFRAPVAFTFQGEDFTSEATFSIDGSEVRWFTQCGE